MINNSKMIVLSFKILVKKTLKQYFIDKKEFLYDTAIQKKKHYYSC